MNPTRCVQASFSHHVLTANSRNTGALAPAPMGIRQDLLNPRQRKRRNWKKESEHRAFSPSELVNLTNHSPTKAPLIKLCSFPRTTLTINHKLGGFNRNSFSHRSGCQKPEIKAFWGHTLKKKALGENPPSWFLVSLGLWQYHFLPLYLPHYTVMASLYIRPPY